MKRIGLLCLLALGLACRSPKSVPEQGALLLHLTCATNLARPTELRAWVYDDHGVLWNAASLGAGKLTCPELGTVLVQPGTFSGPLRLHIAAFADNVPILDNALTVAGLTGARTVDVALAFPLESDDDGDGVPNLIDDCPAVANPDQQGCPAVVVDAAALDVRQLDTIPVVDTATPDTAPVPDAVNITRDAAADPMYSSPDGGGDRNSDASADVVVAQPLANGSACQRGGECESGNCVDGVCCESTCTSLCRSCGLPGSLGHCSLVPAGEDPREVCQEQSAATCGADGVCDGKGACRLRGTGITCAEPRCATTDTLTLAGTCDGSGVCRAGSGQSCSPYACTAGQCKTICSSNSDCATGFNCVNGSCGGKALGTTCSTGAECASGYCVDKVCCNTSSCNGPCLACNVSGQAGSCRPIPAGGLSVNCAAEATATCGRNGRCDGTGQCQLYPVGTNCGSMTCKEAQLVYSSMCDGRGTCQAQPGMDCTPYTCSSNQCLVRCRIDSDCANTNYVCSKSRCVPRATADAGVPVLDAASTTVDAKSRGSW
jgi:hypothetical protein